MLLMWFFFSFLAGAVAASRFNQQPRSLGVTYTSGATALVCVLAMFVTNEYAVQITLSVLLGCFVLGLTVLSAWPTLSLSPLAMLHKFQPATPMEKQEAPTTIAGKYRCFSCKSPGAPLDDQHVWDVTLSPTSGDDSASDNVVYTATFSPTSEGGRSPPSRTFMLGHAKDAPSNTPPVLMDLSLGDFNEFNGKVTAGGETVQPEEVVVVIATTATTAAPSDALSTAPTAAPTTTTISFDDGQRWEKVKKVEDANTPVLKWAKQCSKTRAELNAATSNLARATHEHASAQEDGSSSSQSLQSLQHAVADAAKIVKAVTKKWNEHGGYKGESLQGVPHGKVCMVHAATFNCFVRMMRIFHR